MTRVLWDFEAVNDFGFENRLMREKSNDSEEEEEGNMSNIQEEPETAQKKDEKHQKLDQKEKTGENEGEKEGDGVKEE